MFTNLIFVLIVLLLINFTFEVPIKPLIQSEKLALILGAILYLFTIATIFMQNRIFKRTCKRHPTQMILLTNVELILFLCIFHFFLGATRYFGLHSQSITAAITLSLYLFGLWVFYQTRKRAEFFCEEASYELRMIIPFTVPFILFTLIIDLIKLFPSDMLQTFLNGKADDFITSALLILLSGAFFVLMMVFFPPFLIWIWKCKKIKNGPLKNRLLSLCEKAHFKHGGMRIWTVMPKTLTAAIIGVAPPLRYVIFTEKLLNTLSNESIEAVLAHEIGHSFRKHLLIYPFIIFGMLISVSLFSSIFANPIAFYFALKNQLTPSPLWEATYPLVIFFLYAAIIILYFRFIFGFFSRQFERQADLHVFELNLRGEAMKQALYDVAYGMGVSPKAPSWHHYSIQQRVDFLDEVIKNPPLIIKQHQRVKLYLFSYSFILTCSIALLFIPNIDSKIDLLLNQSLRQKIATEWIQKYKLKGDKQLIEHAIVQNLKTETGASTPGVAEYLSAYTLLKQKQILAAKSLMQAAWEKYDMKHATPEVKHAFESLTNEIQKNIKEST